MEHVLEVRGLVHRYGDQTALAGVDLTVESGECVALLGPNGAGKTTLVRNVIGLIEGNADLIEVAGGHPRSSGSDPLTDREREVLREVGEGHPNVEIAQRLHLAEGTVRNYLSSAIVKLGARNRTEAFAKAQDMGYL